MAVDPITAVLEAGNTIVNKIWPDAGEAERNKINIILTSIATSGGIIKAEAESEHWLVATWRPILMLTFGALIVARWLGFAAPGLQPEEVVKLWDIVELGIGGYVIGRSAEKTLPVVASILKK